MILALGRNKYIECYLSSRVVFSLWEYNWVIFHKYGMWIICYSEPVRSDQVDKMKKAFLDTGSEWEYGHE